MSVKEYFWKKKIEPFYDTSNQGSSSLILIEIKFILIEKYLIFDALVLIIK